MNTFLSHNTKLRTCCKWMAIIETIFLLLYVYIRSSFWEIQVILSLVMIYYFILLYQYLNLAQPYRQKKYKNLLKVLFLLFCCQYLCFLWLTDIERIIHSFLMFFFGFWSISIEDYLSTIVLLYGIMSIYFFILFFKHKTLLSRIMKNSKNVNTPKIIKTLKILACFSIVFTAISITKQISYGYYQYWHIALFKVIIDLILFILLIICIIKFNWIRKSNILFYSFIYTLFFSILFNLYRLHWYYLTLSMVEITVYLFPICNILIFIYLFMYKIEDNAFSSSNESAPAKK